MAMMAAAHRVTMVTVAIIIRTVTRATGQTDTAGVAALLKVKGRHGADTSTMRQVKGGPRDHSRGRSIAMAVIVSIN